MAKKVGQRHNHVAKIELTCPKQEQKPAILNLSSYLLTAMAEKVG